MLHTVGCRFRYGLQTRVSRGGEPWKMAAMNVKGDLLVIERQFSESEIRFACRSKDVGYLGTGSFGETWRVRANRGNEAWKSSTKTAMTANDWHAKLRAFAGRSPSVSSTI